MSYAGKSGETSAIAIPGSWGRTMTKADWADLNARDDQVMVDE